MSGRPFKSGPHFFKILKGDFSQRLRIPPAFVKHIVMDASQRAILKGPSGRSWRVQLSKRVTGTYLQDGWAEFVKDHSLKDSDFLLFRYDGNRRFTVRIFDKTACEREEVITCNTRRKSAFSSGRTLRSTKMAYSDSGHHPPTGTDTVKQQSDNVHSPHTSQCNNKVSAKRKHMPALKNNRCKKIKTEDVDVPMCRTYAKRACCSKPLTEEREQAFENAKSFSKASRFPNCLLVLSKSNLFRAYMMNLPSCFTREHLPKRKTIFSVRDPEGRGWDVIYIPHVSGRGCLSGGWGAYARANNLEIGDICVFEVVGECQMKVHVFH